MGLLSGTRPTTLGARQGRLAPCPRRPNCVSSQTDAAADPGHHVAPLAVSGDPHAAWTAVRALIQGMPRARIVSEAPGYLHAEFTSRLLGFVDDVELLLDPPARLIHVRSASRLGSSDFGVNRSRVESIRARLTAAKPS
ncbi:MAG: DUF1499 domain-containing protein [Candidatus Rokubacteria bacterium]|nr:DUF1499 domain-containing protein [Candidatus Rokubacteria bacterium]